MKPADIPDLGAVLLALARLEEAIEKLAASIPPPPVAYTVPTTLRTTHYMES